MDPEFIRGRWCEDSFVGGGGGQRLIFVILLLRCEFNQFEFFKEGGRGPYPAAHGLKYGTYSIVYNYFTRRRSKNRYNETIDFSGHEYPTKVDFVYQRKCTQCYKDHCMFKPRIISLFSFFLDFTTRSRVLPIVNLIIVPSHNGFLIYFFIFILARRQPMFN